MKLDQVILFQEYTELQSNPASNSKRIEVLEAALVQMNQGLIYYVARRYPAIRHMHAEVLTVGMASLLKAVRSYDPSLGDFGPYAVQQLRSSDGLQSIDRFHSSGPIKIPHNAFVSYLKEKRELNKETTDSENPSTHLSANLSEEGKAVDTAISCLCRFGDDSKDSTTLEESIEQNTFEAPSEAVEARELSCLLSESLNALESRERLVIHYLFGLDETQGAMDLRSIGRKLSISHERVRQIRDKALERLKRKMTKSLSLN